MFEVETKIKLEDNDVDFYRKKIEKISKKEKTQKKEDSYFAIQKIFYPKKAFRIRKSGDKNIVNFKKWKRKFWSKDIVVKEEFEFEINDPKNFIELMKNLGFSEWIRKEKISEIYRYKEDRNLEIEINKVKHLGYFIEIEYLCKKNEIEKAKRVIRKFLKEIEMPLEKINNTGYTKMLWKKWIK